MTQRTVHPHSTGLVGSGPGRYPIGRAVLHKNDQMATILFTFSTRGCFADNIGNCRTVAT
jgi:hypothetical protein